MTIYTPTTITEEIEQNFKPTRLSVKECNGIRYLCKSTRQDFEKYKGSGVHWMKIIKKYGRKNVKTLWVSDWFYCPHHLQDFALMYSEYNQVVESDGWANLKPENGLDGGGAGGEKNGMWNKNHTEESISLMKSNRKQTTVMYGEDNPMYGKTGELHHRYGVNHTEETKISMRKPKSVPRQRVVCDCCGKEVAINTLGQHKRSKACTTVVPIKKEYKNPKSILIQATDPDGQTYEIFGGFEKFCKQNSLAYASAQKALHTGKPVGGSVEGWSFTRI
jgi:hypothetical protein